jgi:hypothetical protein
MEVYQTFTVTKLNYRVLPATAFRTLQKAAFPVYFQTQVVLLLLVAVTFPPGGFLSLLEDKVSLIAFGAAGVPAILNYLVYGPRTIAAMINKTHQGKLRIILPVCARI